MLKLLLFSVFFFLARIVKSSLDATCAFSAQCGDGYCCKFNSGCYCSHYFCMELCSHGDAIPGISLIKKLQNGGIANQGEAISHGDGKPEGEKTGGKKMIFKAKKHKKKAKAKEDEDEEEDEVEDRSEPKFEDEEDSKETPEDSKEEDEEDEEKEKKKSKARKRKVKSKKQQKKKLRKSKKMKKNKKKMAFMRFSKKSSIKLSNDSKKLLLNKFFKSKEKLEQRFQTKTNNKSQVYSKLFKNSAKNQFRFVKANSQNKIMRENKQDVQSKMKNLFHSFSKQNNFY